ncbi:MAG: dioxygenase family protein [Candidatus Nanopelagicales bacterium]
MSTVTDRMPAVFLGHGAPPLLDDRLWCAELSAWAGELPRPKAILIVSAHWEQAPISLSAAAAATPLIYDFGGFDPKYYSMQYSTPDASALSTLVTSVLPDGMTVHQHASRGLDHGAWVPLKVMYPDADIPVLQLSLPTHDPETLLEIGRRLAPLRDAGVLIIGSGFLTHGLPYLRDWSTDAKPPGWSVDFDLWANDAMARGDLDTLMDYRNQAPGMPYAHPTVEHLSPLFVALGAASAPDSAPSVTIDGYFYGLAKRSIQVA